MDVVHKWPKAMQIWPKLSGLGADLAAALVSPDFEDDRFPDTAPQVRPLSWLWLRSLLWFSNSHEWNETYDPRLPIPHASRFRMCKTRATENLGCC